MAWCAVSERCEFDVRKKLVEWGITGVDADRIVDSLKSEKFLDNERFLLACIKDKMIFGKWGRMKIEYHLRGKGFTEQEIASAFDTSTDHSSYRQMVKHELEKKNTQVKDNDTYKRKAKLIQFGSSRGYELEIVIAVTDEIIQYNTL
jgi:regulatory protein